jgi:hypothetical protein
MDLGSDQAGYGPDQKPLAPAQPALRGLSLNDGGPVGGCGPISAPEILKKVAVPQLENQKPPDLVRLIALTAKVFVEQAGNSLGVEISALQSSGLQ